MSSPPVSPAAFARACVEALVGGRPAPPPPADESYEAPAACFVSIKTQGGDLRGCIGTLTPCEPCLGDEIARNAYAAAFSDPRFYPVRPAELADLVYSVDILSDSEPTTLDGLDPARFGVIVTLRSPSRRAPAGPADGDDGEPAGRHRPAEGRYLGRRGLRAGALHRAALPGD